MERIINADSNNKRARPRKKIKSSTIFVIVMLIYPVAHFLLMWVGVNFNSILLSFQQLNINSALEWRPFNDLFGNFRDLFERIANDSDMKKMLIYSVSFSVVSCFVILPISLLFSYFIFKKIVGSGFFKIIFFLPSILPLIVLTLVYSAVLKPSGPIGMLLGQMGIDTTNIFVTSSGEIKWMIWIFCVWAGIGYDVILLTAGMARIPRDILESCKMDGVPPLKEFFRVVIPLTWPTITTLFVLGLMAMFTVYLQPYFLTGGYHPQEGLVTVGLEIYFKAQSADKATPATLGLFLSIIGAPIIMTIRHFLNKMFAEVNY